MARQGYRSYPLIVTEFGVLMPDDYGFTTERVNSFMSATFDFLQNTADAGLGDPMDGNRLVQKWSYSAFPHLVRDGRLTPMGKAYRELAEKYAEGSD